MKTFIIFLTVLATFSVSLLGAQPAIEWDGSQANFFSDDDGPFTLGFQFRAESDITVTALGPITTARTTTFTLVRCRSRASRLLRRSLFSVFEGPVKHQGWFSLPFILNRFRQQSSVQISNLFPCQSLPVGFCSAAAWLRFLS